MLNKDSVRSRIDSIKEARALSLTQIAIEIDMEYQKARRFLRNPDPECGPIMKALARCLKVSEKWLSSGDGNPDDGLNFIPVCTISALDQIQSRALQEAADDIMKVIIDTPQIFIPERSLCILSHQPSALALYKNAESEGFITQVKDNTISTWGYYPVNQKLEHIGYIKSIHFST